MSEYKTMIGIPQGEYTNVRNVCKDISVKDASFRYRIVKPVLKLRDKFERILIIYSPTEKEANQRGGWFIHKMTDAVVSNYFWVK